jgi:inorganic pyrophosphatase
MQPSFEVFIEMPQGTKNYKFERDAESGRLFLDYVYEDLSWPFNYGEILHTAAADGKGLDAIIFSSHPLGLGAVVECVPLGVMLMSDNGVPDNKILMIPAIDPIDKQLKDITDLTEAQKNQIVELYKEIAKQRHKEILFKSFEGRDVAEKLIAKSRI